MTLAITKPPNTMILTMGTPQKVPLILGNPHLEIMYSLACSVSRFWEAHVRAAMRGPQPESASEPPQLTCFSHFMSCSGTHILPLQSPCTPVGIFRVILFCVALKLKTLNRAPLFENPPRSPLQIFWWLWLQAGRRGRAG